MDMLAELRAIVGENNVLTEDADTAGYLVARVRLWCLSRATRVWWEEEPLRQRATRFCCLFHA